MLGRAFKPSSRLLLVITEEARTQPTGELTPSEGRSLAFLFQTPSWVLVKEVVQQRKKYQEA